MVSTGFTLAVLTMGGFLLIYRKLPTRLRLFMQKHVLLTDAVMCLLTYMLFGGTLVALFAAAWMGVLTSILLAIMHNDKAVRALDYYYLKLAASVKKFMAWLEERIPSKEDETSISSPADDMGDEESPIPRKSATF